MGDAFDNVVGIVCDVHLEACFGYLDWCEYNSNADNAAKVVGSWLHREY